MGRIIKLLISLFIFIFDSFFLFISRLSGKRRSRGLVLMYHAVTPFWRRRFIRQLNMIKSYTTPIRARKGALPPGGGRYTAISFDDGFQCLMENVVPEMDKRGLPWTLFIPTAYMGQRPGWDFWGDDSENYAIMTEDLLARLGENPLITLGSHSVSHPRFSELSREQRMIELTRSREVLSQIAGEEVQGFAFPYGDCTEEFLQEARDAGYTEVFTISPVYTTLEDEPRGIGRIQVDPWDWPLEFFLKLMGAYRWLPLAFTAKRTVKSLFQGKNNRKVKLNE